eukprot:TRINITY_DN11777_c0_g1_i1.p1 TRINITY_DN11777_c0_g1~~TRINITY_DN11777_c0_g1_i1.p1  ORF type:complete len:303 (-),score=98.16 TRINITY_DN11777_c0_g1_i1:20-928(-)
MDKLCPLENISSFFSLFASIDHTLQEKKDKLIELLKCFFGSFRKYNTHYERMGRVVALLNGIAQRIEKEENFSTVLDIFTEFEQTKEKLVPIFYQSKLAHNSIQNAFDESFVKDIENIFAEDKKIFSDTLLEAPKLDVKEWESLKTDVLVEDDQDVEFVQKIIETRVALSNYILSRYMAHKDLLISSHQRGILIDKFLDLLHGEINQKIENFKKEFLPKFQTLNISALQDNYLNIYEQFFIKFNLEWNPEIPKYKIKTCLRGFVTLLEKVSLDDLKETHKKRISEIRQVVVELLKERFKEQN